MCACKGKLLQDSTTTEKVGQSLIAVTGVKKRPSHHDSLLGLAVVHAYINRSLLASIRI